MPAAMPLWLKVAGVQALVRWQTSHACVVGTWLAGLPLAVVVMGGLITSTLLTLIVLPTVYALFARRWGGGGSEARGQVLPVARCATRSSP